MRRPQHSNSTATAIITLIFILLSTCLFTTSTAQTTSLRCQKSGCREGDNNDESSSPTLIVTKPKSKLFPTLISYITAFLLLRLGFRYMKKIIPTIRDKLPQIRYMIGHYYHDYILSSSTSSADIRRVSRRRSSRDNSSYISLGSLAEFVDSDHSVGSTTVGEDDNDSYSTKSGYSTETGTSVGLSELLSDNDTTTTTEAFNSRSLLAGRRRGSVGRLMNSVASSAGTSCSSYDSSKDDEEDASTIGGTTISSRASILSKFLNYITDANNNGTATSSRHDQMTQRERNGIYGQHNAHPKRRSSIDYSIFSSSNNNNSSNDIEKQRAYKHDNYYSRSSNGNDQQLSETTTTRQRPRRSTVDDSFNHHHSTSTYLTSHHNTMTKDKSSNASMNSSGIKMRKSSMVASAVAKEKSSQTTSQTINEGSEKKKVHQMQQLSKKKQQQTIPSHNDGSNDDDDDKQKKKSSLHHHLSKFVSSSSSSSKKNDDENYSTMMSTVDLRTRASVATGLSTKLDYR
jgi:hypothetical protein